MTVLDHLPDTWTRSIAAGSEIVTLLDTDDRLLYVNHIDDAPATYIGRLIYDYVDGQYHDVLRAAVTAVRRTGLPQHFDTRRTDADGVTTQYSNWVGAVTGHMADGVVAFISTDVTRQDLMAAQLELSELTLRSLIDNSPDSILIVDRDRRIVFVNRLTAGLELADVLGQPAESFVPEHDRQKVIDAISRVLSTGETFSYTTGFDAVPGEMQFITRVVPIPGDDGIHRVMLVATDVTAQVAAEAEQQDLASALHQAQKMESLGQLTGGVAHDFSNLLVAISGNLELAQLCDHDPAERDRRIVAALEAVQHANTLTGRLLAFSRKQTLRPRPVDVGALVTRLHDVLDSSVGAGVAVALEVDDALRCCRVDPGQLESSLLNLAVNARDAMPDGGNLVVRVRDVAIAEDDGAPVPAGEYVLIEVADDGAGMSEDVAVQAFEPFFTTKDVGRGTGLGLSMVYGFVLQSGGHVRLVTELDRGTTVQIYLRASRGSTPGDLDARPEPDPVPGHRELLLLVEDNELVRSLTARLLDRLGYRAIVASRAEEALDLLAREPDIALMITDLVLPDDVDGFELADRARLARDDLPILFVSGYPRDILVKRRGRDLTDSLLAKPYTTRQLADAVSRQLAASTPTAS